VTRKTEQRRAIQAAIENAEGPLTIPEILDRASEQVPGLGTATVYRNVKAAVEEGSLTPVDVPGEPTRYEAGKVFDIEGCFAELNRLAPAEFLVEGHELTLYGHCPGCRPPQVF
jgi:Fur family ferric uptake transcriptional regulator